jgi:TolA-binding protein
LTGARSAICGLCLGLAACASTQAPAPVEPLSGEKALMAERARLLDELQRCRDGAREERRRAELQVRDGNRRAEELQKKVAELENKLNAILAIDRESRRRSVR